MENDGIYLFKHGVMNGQVACRKEIQREAQIYRRDAWSDVYMYSQDSYICIYVQYIYSHKLYVLLYQCIDFKVSVFRH